MLLQTANSTQLNQPVGRLYDPHVKDSLSYKSVTSKMKLPEGKTELGCRRGFTLFGIESGAAECRLWDAQQSATGALSRGALFIAPSDGEFFIDLDRPCRAVAVQFEWPQGAYGLPSWNKIGRRIFRDLLIFETVLRLHEENRSKAGTSKDLVASASSLLMTTLNVVDARLTIDLRRTNGNAHLGLQNAVEWIENNLSERITVNDLAEIAGLSDWHFLRQFKMRYQRSPHRYLQERRLAKAKELLADSELQISHIAYECGFSSQSHLTTTFKQYFGNTPGGFRSHKRGCQVKLVEGPPH